MIETGEVQPGDDAWGGWLQVPLLLVPRCTFAPLVWDKSSRAVQVRLTYGWDGETFRQ